MVSAEEYINYSQVPLEEVLSKEQKPELEYIGVLFSASYCPPC